MEWRTQCKGHGKVLGTALRRGQGRIPEWMCMECEEPLEECVCASAVVERLTKAMLKMKSSKDRRRAMLALVRWQQRRSEARGYQG